MTGAKTNERPGTRAQVRYLRMSASKARVVLDLIRGKSVTEANQILHFSQRGAAKEIQKVLRSAVANAQNNDEQIAEELYVSACYADEGPTLKRFRPRARGRAGRINKQTCHVTLIVSRMEEDVLDRMRDKAAGRSSGGSPDRRARVAKSRGEQVPATEQDDTVEEIAAEDTAVEDTAVEDTAVEDTAVEDTAVEETSAEETAAEQDATAADEDVAEDETASEVESTTADDDADGEASADDDVAEAGDD